jgi:hypothetical protein
MATSFVSDDSSAALPSSSLNVAPELALPTAKQYGVPRANYGVTLSQVSDITRKKTLFQIILAECCALCFRGI